MKAVLAALSMALGLAFAAEATAQSAPEVPSNPLPHFCAPAVEDPAPAPAPLIQPGLTFAPVTVLLAQNPLFRPLVLWLSADRPGYADWHVSRPTALHPRRRR